MYFLRGHLFRCATYIVNQNQLLYNISIHNKVHFHRSVYLLDSSKKVDSSEVKPTPDDGVWIEPPHPISQLRLKVFPKSENLSEEEKAFYAQCKETQEWNHQYWEAHNKDFRESRSLFIAKVAHEKNLTTDEVAQSEEMSRFYQQFLKRNHSKHIAYNWNWYQRNFQLLYLNAKANLSKVKRMLRK